MKRLALAVAALLLLTGCGDGPDANGDQAPMHHYTFVQELPDGGTVLCVATKSYNSGGVSCDWARATP